MANWTIQCADRYLVLTMIQTIYREEKLLKDFPAEERKIHRQLSVRPLVEAYFMWARENILKVPQKSRTWEGFNYSINQGKYLKVFLDDGEVPMDNNAAEQSIRGFCIGRKNWVMIDTVAGAKSSAIIQLNSWAGIHAMKAVSLRMASLA